MFAPLNSFDDVAARYESIKPVTNGQLGEEFRPLGSRKRPYERIIKVDEGTYALTEGNYNPRANHEGNMVHLTTAPILWERKPEGDFISIRGCPKGAHWPTRWAFIATYLPMSIRLACHQEGIHQHQIYYGGAAYPLLPIQVERSGAKVRDLIHTNDMSIVFKALPDGTFERSGVVEVTTKKVDKERKAQLKPEMEEFYKYILTMAPFVVADFKDFAVRMKHISYLDAKGIVKADSFGFAVCNLLADRVRPLLTAPDDSEDKMKLMWVVSDGLYFSAVGGKESLKHFRARYNRWFIDLFDLYKKELY